MQVLRVYPNNERTSVYQLVFFAKGEQGEDAPPTCKKQVALDKTAASFN